MAIVLPQLGPWAKSHLQSIIQATNQTDFDAAFDAFVAKEVHVTFNGENISRDEYKKRLRAEAFDEAGAVVTFNGVTTVPGKDESLGGATSSFIGEAGIFYTAIIAEAIVVQGASVESKITSSINISVKNDPSVPKPPAGIRGFYDPRRVFTLNQVSTDAPADSST
ncbi:hypothetical protein D9757_013872 [Collybiopsis confluens]|uniref:Uncharacterized protein n=1 Tax=Collybiopsis confluens TaxID=2823264 RepID=A0A8H5CR53_9AGAR|nr:hypothetical protein D9757_013872 [Collybiopsis confluens]